ncbi:MAG: hypothetical protein K2R98_20505 [Gemmataceae bacterium]|nr:hypothetical protein [Gemmataceae bacterium]
MSTVLRWLFVPLLLAGIALSEPSSTRSQSPTPTTAAQTTDIGWPRKITNDGVTVTVYQPQVEKWEANKIELRAAVSVLDKAAADPTFGVIWASARTDVDKEHRLVTLDDFKVTKANFPAAADKNNVYLDLFRKQGPQGTRVVSLDRLEANLAVTRAENKTPTQPVKNEPPQIIVSTKPAILVLIDGKPALRQVEGSTLLRIINTRSLILLDQANGKYYLHMMDRWMTATAIDGTWTVAVNPPATLAPVLKTFTDNPQVDLMDHLADDVADEFASGTIPVIHVSTVPAELIEVRGTPNLSPIDGTKLLWVSNSSDQLLLDTLSGNYYVLVSGRWFRAKSLKGPWEFAPADKLPADFAKIPEQHPRGDVLTSVSGTPQAQESLIANSVPQTAAISRKEAQFTPLYDGKPQFQPVDGTKLRYAVNAPTPIIEVTPQQFFAVENGVWFTATSPTGPWTVATSVPAAIYTIPPSSPIYYATQVVVYDSTPEVVYVGYTPGYFGTCVSPQNVVVYGTGYNFAPWVGAYWFGRPWTYGFGARFSWTAAGWGCGFGSAVGRPWWGPVGWHAGWGGNAWHDGWRGGYGGRYSNTHINNVNFGNFNAYNRWGNNVHVNQNNTFAPSKTTNITNQQRGFNNVMATHDGNVVRRTNNGWEQNTAKGWQHYDPKNAPENMRPEMQKNLQQYDKDWAARRDGEANHQNFRASTGHAPEPPRAERPEQRVGGPGGFNGNPGGFRGAPAGGGRRGGRR